MYFSLQNKTHGQPLAKKRYINDRRLLPAKWQCLSSQICQSRNPRGASKASLTNRSASARMGQMQRPNEISDAEQWFPVHLLGELEPVLSSHPLKRN